MKKIKKWRYYCEYCKKSGGHGWAIERHERYCTMNPDRQCRMCDVVDGGMQTGKYVEFVLANKMESDFDKECFNEKHFEKLWEQTSHCPACTLSALRQAGVVYHDFNYAEEVVEMWKIHKEYE